MSARVVQFGKPKRGGPMPFVKWILFALTIGVFGCAAWIHLKNIQPQDVAIISSRYFPICGSGARSNCVVDGDTVWINGTKIRLEDVDTPEVFRPLCAREKQIGDRAKVRLQGLLNKGEFEMWRRGSRDADRYGRLLRTLGRDGKSFGPILIEEGLAARWGGREVDWCNGN